MKKGILTILVAVFALFLLTGCSVAGHTHAWILQEKIEATCEKDGASIFVCECGKKLARESSAVGHDWEEWERAETYILYACLHCATKKVETILPPVDSSEDSSSGELPADSSSSEEEVDSSSSSDLPIDSSSSEDEVDSSSSSDLPIDSSSSEDEVDSSSSSNPPVDSSSSEDEVDSSSSSEPPMDSSSSEEIDSSSSSEPPMDSSSSEEEIDSSSSSEPPMDSSSSEEEIDSSSSSEPSADSSSSEEEIDSSSSNEPPIDSSSSEEEIDSSSSSNSSIDDSSSDADNPPDDSGDNPNDYDTYLEAGRLLYEKTIDGAAYVCIGAENAQTMLELIIPDTHEGLPVTGIKENAFIDCKRLLCVHLGKNLQTPIGVNAFWGCSNITEVHNYYGLELADYWIDEVYHSSGILNENPMVYTTLAEHGFSCDTQGFISYPMETGKRLIGYVGSEKDLTLPQEITAINKDVFGLIEGLRSVTLGDDVREIGSYVFRGCTTLQKVTFGKNLERILSPAFQDCKVLTEAVFTNPRGWKTVLNSGEMDCFEAEDFAYPEDIARYLVTHYRYRWEHWDP